MALLLAPEIYRARGNQWGYEPVLLGGGKHGHTGQNRDPQLIKR